MFFKRTRTEIYENLTQVLVADSSLGTDRRMDERTWSVHKGVLFLTVKDSDKYVCSPAGLNP
jgi:hypothetical protein